MTLKDIAELPKEVLTCKDIAPILGANQTEIHQQALERPELLGFNVIVIKRNVRIPKQAFLNFMRGINENIDMEEINGNSNRKKSAQESRTDNDSL